MEEYSDAQLAKKSLENPEFFGEIVTRYQQKLDRFLYRIGALELHEREDLLQEVFIKVYKNLNDVDETLSFASWIFRIARNTFIDSFRKKSSRGKKIELNDEEAEIFWNTIPDNSINVEDDFASKQRKKIVESAIEKISGIQKEAIILFFLEEKSYEEISDILQKNKNTVATLISRGKKQLKAIIEKEYNFLI